MTISSQTSKTVGRGNGVTTAFTYAFLIPDANSVRVSYINAAGLITVLSASQYNISGLGSPFGGTVTYPLVGSPIAAGTSITIERTVPYTQTARLTDQGGYYPAVVEGALDNLAMQIQQLAGSAAFALALTFPSVDVSPVTVLPPAAARAGLFLAFDGSGNPTLLPATGIPGDLSPYSTLATGGVTSRTFASRFADVINVKDEGCLGNGVANDSAAFLVALGKITSGSTFYIPNGTFVLGTAIVKDLSAFTNVTIRCDGEIQLANTVVTGLDLQGGWNHDIELRFAGGGDATGTALKISKMNFGTVSVFGQNVNGTLLTVAGNRQDLTYSRFMKIRRVHAYQCGRAIIHGDNIGGKYGDSFGVYEHVITNNCTNGNIFRNTNDVVIENFDHYGANTQTIGTDFDTCGSFHFGVFQTGGIPTTELVRITGSNRFTFQKLYLLSENAGVVNGLYIDSSPYINILDCRALFFNKAIEVVNGASTSLRIENYYGEGNTTDMREFGVNKTLPLVSQYDSGGGTIESANRVINTAYKLGFRCASGRYPYFVQQADNNFVFYGRKSDDTTFAIFSVLMDQATVSPITFNQITKVTQGGDKLIITDGGVGNGVSLTSVSQNEATPRPFIIVASTLRLPTASTGTADVPCARLVPMQDKNGLAINVMCA